MITTSSFRCSAFSWATGLVVFAGTVLVSSQCNADFVPVNFSDQANWTYSAADVDPVFGSVVHLPEAPTGLTTLGGVPFSIMSNASGKQAWNAYVAGGGMQTGPTSLTIDVNVFGATNVYTLINTFFGAPGPNSYASLVFHGSAGAVYTDDLVGNVDIRDWIQPSGYTNSINGTTTANVYTGASGVNTLGRLDMQSITLPAAFASQVLTSITLIDDGSTAVLQRVILDGVTINSVPEPRSFLLMVLGVGIVAVARRSLRVSVRRA